MPGPDGSLGPLDPATKVIEFESLGTKVRNTRRFFVVNPTSVPYDFVWESEGEPSEAARTHANLSRLWHLHGRERRAQKERLCALGTHERAPA